MTHQWRIFKDNEQVILNDFDYLSYLLDQSEKAIKNYDKFSMQCVIWDLQEIKEYTNLFYSINKIRIDSEIATLKRLSQYKPFKKKPE